MAEKKQTKKINKVIKNDTENDTKINIFFEKDLFTFEELKIFMNNNLTNEKASMLSNKLINYAFIIEKKNNIFMIDNNLVYQNKGHDIKPFLRVIVSKYLETSFKKLTNEQQLFIKTNIYPEDDNNNKKTNSKPYNKMMSNKGIDMYLDQLKYYMTKDIKIDNYKYQIHFLNGFINLKTLKFEKRVFGRDFVSNIINRNYEPSSKEDKDEIYSIINKIYPNSNERDYILSQLGRAISGDCIIEQSTLFLLGKGSSGKSLIMTLTKEALEKYVKELSADAFEKDNKNINKILNEFDNNPIIRIVWTNEMTDKKTDDSLFKSVCDGRASTVKLYQDGQHDILFNSKFIFTSNEMPNIKIDTGIIRRLEVYEHKSKFVDDEKEVNETKNIYLKDKYLISKIRENNNLLNAFSQILFEHCKFWSEKKAPQQTEAFRDAKQTLISSNDVFQDFIDSCLTRTNDPNDRIGKEHMKNLFMLKFPKKHITIQQIISSLKDKQVNYNCKYRADGVQGCFICVKEKDNDDEQNDTKEEQSNNIIDNSNIMNKIQELENKLKQIEEENILLKEENKRLKEKSNNEVEPKKEIQDNEENEKKVIKVTAKNKVQKIVNNFEDMQKQAKKDKRKMKIQKKEEEPINNDFADKVNDDMKKANEQYLNEEEYINENNKKVIKLVNNHLSDSKKEQPKRNKKFSKPLDSDKEWTLKLF